MLKKIGNKTVPVDHNLLDDPLPVNPRLYMYLIKSCLTGMVYMILLGKQELEIIS